MIEVGSLVYIIAADISRFEPTINKVDDRIENTVKDRTIKFKGEDSGISKTFESIESRLDSLLKNFEKVNRPAERLQSIFAGFTGAMLFETLKGGIEKVKEFGEACLGTAGDFEQYQTSLTVMLGSTVKANSLLEIISKTAIKTPLELPQLVKGAQNLIAFGVSADSVIEKMIHIGDAAQGVPDKFERLVAAYGKLCAKGKASLEELNMFTEAGVPILAALSKQFGVTDAQMFKMIETGKVGFADVDKALTSLTTGTGQFAGMMEKQATTYKGLVSTYNDSISALVRSIGDRLLPTAKQTVIALTDIANSVNDMVKPSAIENIKKEQEALNLLVSQITLTNEGSKERTLLIEKLQRDYPGFLGNIDREKVTNELLVEQLAKANDEYIKKIALQSASEKLEQQLQETGKKLESVKSQELVVNEKIIAVLTKINDKEITTAVLSKKTAAERIQVINDILSSEVKLAENNNKSNEEFTNQSNNKKNHYVGMLGYVKALQGPLFELKKLEDEYTKSLNSSNEATRYYNQLKESLNINIKEETNSTKENTETKKQNIVSIEAIYTDYSRRMTALQNGEIKSIGTRLQEEKNLQKIYKDNDLKSYEELLSKKYTAYSFYAGEIARANEGASKKTAGSIAESLKTYDNISDIARKNETTVKDTSEQIKRQVEATGTTIKNSNSLTFSELAKEIAFASGNIYTELTGIEGTFSKTANTILKTSTTTMTGIITAMNTTYEKEWQKTAVVTGQIVDGALKTASSIVNTVYESLADNLKKEFEAVKNEYDRTIAQIDAARNRELKEVEANEKTQLAMFEETGAQKLEKLKKQLKEATTLEEKKAIEEKIKEQEKQNAKEEIVRAAEKRKADIEEKSRRAKIDADNNLAKKKYDLDVEQFKYKRAIDIANVWISAATGTVAAWASAASWPGPSMIAGMALAGVLTGLINSLAGIQTGVIMAKNPPPEPEYQSYSTGGIIRGNNYEGIDKTLALVTPGEIVINNKQQGKLWNALSSGNYGGDTNIYVTVYLDTEEIPIEKILVKKQRYREAY